jgi:hypothetical protein
LIATTLGHQLNLSPISAGQQSGATQTVDVLLKYGEPTRESFLVEVLGDQPGQALRPVELDGCVREAKTVPLPGIVGKLQATNPRLEGALVNDGIGNLNLRQIHPHAGREHAG